ncbi:TlpA family protein disulfide reductase [Terriglobus sp. TAA 43]|uniref:TlpA family protein disulfide reductase n=1 Tax=Terriglobus sp. TAA 43 TaxID=278961 RepID=UPI0006479EDB|nr:TlpA family protein disulfide reductase [Terriglobus sp. TAA 43]
MNRFAAHLLSALILTTVQGASSAQAPQLKNDFIPADARKAAPDFTITDVYGKQVTLSKYKGHVVLLDFWAVNCGGCKQEIPWYVDFESRYGKSGLSLIGLDMYGESPDMVKAFMAQSKMTYPVAIGTDALGERFGLREMPLTLLIDRKGRIAVAHAGVVDRDVFDREIQKLLAE